MDLKTALDIFNIKNEISIHQLKILYRNLAKAYHPDMGDNSDKISDINNAYKYLKNYLENYKIKVRDLRKGSVEERTLRRFKNDWLGGNFNE